MAVRPIVRYPDAALSRRAAPIERFDEDLRQLVGDIVDTMAAAPAVGLTAVHIGVPLRVVVIRLDIDAPPAVYINPDLLWSSDETESHTEGSVSLPGVSEAVTRPARVRLRFQDIEGHAQEAEAAGFLSACLQHEIDQLDGIFWTARLSRLKRERLHKKAEKVARGGRSG